MELNISTMTAIDASEAVRTSDSINDLRKVAKDLEVSHSGNTGLETLREKIMKVVEDRIVSDPNSRDEFTSTGFGDMFNDDGLDEIEVAKPVQKPKGPSVSQMLKMDPSDIEDVALRRNVIRAHALRMVRVTIQNVDPADSVLDGGIITILNKYTGKISKYVPYGEESEGGYHLPWMLYEHLRDWKFPLRKEVKGGQFGVKTYKTTMVNKFKIDILPMLTMDELKELANHQRASQSIDKVA
jgi:hypothetical protein